MYFIIYLPKSFMRLPPRKDMVSQDDAESRGEINSYKLKNLTMTQKKH